MENKPLVSVLICAYNVEKYIEECINAVINQTYKNLEIIIVNDGSSDNTYFLLKKLAEKDNRIKILNFNNHIGIISALNEGLKEIAGEYIARTDSDDITKPDWIEKILTCIMILKSSLWELILLSCQKKIMVVCLLIIIKIKLNGKIH
ncbi:glycosyltransferase family 2 protein [Pasteurella multocida]|nr:glycosyltransferase family 2 protein [Pasteurella multocida]MDY0576500.1 glycosyltransferase family 2 protein [Pasteurella multocida]